MSTAIPPALSLVFPTLPLGATTISVDSSVLPLVIDAPVDILAIDVVLNGALTTLTSFTVVNGLNRFSGSVDISFALSSTPLQITGRNYLDGQNPAQPEHTQTLQFEILYSQSNLGTSIAPPSGVTVYKGASTCKVEWALPTYQGFQGVRVMWSPDPSGVTSPYQQYGAIQNNVTRSAEVTLTGPATATTLTANPTVTGQQPTNTQVVTATSITTTTNFGSISIPSAAVQGASPFYVLLTTLVEDPVTNTVYESQAAGPYTCGFVNLKVVNPTDFLALQKQNDIALRMVANMSQRRPDLDLTPRSEFRDVVINALALELATMSIREWFSRCAMSISAIAQIDDQDGDGISDPVASSTVKQQIAQAYGLSQAAVQSFIDQRFDILGEQAGLPRGGATTAVTLLTCYTYSLPTSPIVVPEGMLVSTIPDTANPVAISFMTRSTATIDSRNAASFYDPENNWWSVQIPAEAVNTGANGNVGAETLVQIASGGPSGLAVINLDAATGGSDEQSNSDYAAMIRNRQVVGKDSGSRSGYWTSAMQTPGIIDALVVPAGHVDMVRDWSSQLAKHTYGCVDVYVRGLTSSQQTELLPYSMPASSIYQVYSTYLSCTLLDITRLAFSIQGFTALTAPIYTAVEMLATSAGRTVWLGTENAQFDNTLGVLYLNPNDQPYVVNVDGSTTVWQINSADATNQQFLQAASPQTTFTLMAQLQSGIHHIPTLQPVTQVNTITGPVTGSLAAEDISLVHTGDFLLTGGSNDAGDAVVVSGTLTAPMVKTLTLATATVAIDSDMSVTVDNSGNPGNVISVRSSDLSTVYEFGVDYSIVSSGKYRSYSLQVLNDSVTGQPRIPLGSNAQVVVAYYQYLLREQVTLQTDSITLNGSTPASLSQGGFVQNVWLPVNHGQTALAYDGQPVNGQSATGLMGAGVEPTRRYIKVTYSNGQNTVVMLEGKDFTLSVSDTGVASLTRVLGGSIPDGGTVTVSYYTVEVLSIATEYPAYVEQLVSTLDETKDAGADVLVKAMVANAVDFILNVTLDEKTTPDAVDGIIRTAIDLVFSASQTQLYQSEIIRRVQSVTGVVSVGLPLLKCARSDGSYDIGHVIPTGTAWNALALDSNFSGLTLPPNSFISAAPVLPNPTIPSGGTANNYVGLLYEGQAYRRAMSVADFCTSKVPSFYIIGANDRVDENTLLPASYAGEILVTNPGTAGFDPSLLSFRVTYQVFGAASSDDIRVASCEYIVPGTVTINYIQGA